ncbi:hypothetical protein TNCV_3481771 [Trichonephila clavipes]|nr:hypothetical protein TNCV_3481771 [Trichonephila clavipes]
MPVLAPTVPSSSNRREQVIWTRLRLGHTRLTHRHLLLDSCRPIPAPECPSGKQVSSGVTFGCKLVLDLKEGNRLSLICMKPIWYLKRDALHLDPIALKKFVDITVFVKKSNCFELFSFSLTLLCDIPNSHPIP